jgi:serine/threonine protein phosphatase PrpC
MLNRAIGLGLFVRPDVTSFKLRDGDRIVICSDGLWSAVEDEDLAAMAAGSDASSRTSARRSSGRP